MNFNQLLEKELFAEIRNLLDETKVSAEALFNQQQAQKNLELVDILAFLEVELDELFLAFTDFDNFELFLNCNEINIEERLTNLIYLEEKLLNFNFNILTEEIILLSDKVKPSLSRLIIVLTDFSFSTGLI